MGQKVPDITLPSTSRCSVNLAAEAKGKHVVALFYPGDREGLRYPELAGCTPEACSFRDHLHELRGLGAEVFGINLHMPERQREFIEREYLTFELLSDHDERLAPALEMPIWVSDVGERFVVRTTIVFRRGGEIVQVFRDVHVDGHVNEVLVAVRQIS